MSLRVLTVLLLVTSITAAKSATRPSSPTTRPARTAPVAERPATRPVENTKSTLAREIIAKYGEQKKKEKEQIKVAYIDLDRPLTESPARFALLADTRLTLQSVISRLHKARDDKALRGVLINLGETEFNLSQAQEIRDAISEIRKEGKRVFVYADSYGTASYVAASSSKDICTLSGGEIMIPGIGMETMFAKGLLDKVGVKAEYVQIGQYKGADEQFTRTEPSKEFRGEINKILDSLFDQIVDGIAFNRNIPRTEVQDMINGVMISGKLAKQRGFVDHLVDQDGLRDLMKKEMGRDVNLLHDYGVPKRDAADLTSPLGLLSALGKKPVEEENEGPQVAVIYAEGVIVDGESGDDLFMPSGEIGAEDLRKAFRIASRDENVKAIVLRIDSPGGSAAASEVMWQAARRAAKDKPLIISIGSMAASGGYYLASAGDHIFADPTAIVGSIGVVGGKFVLKDLFGKIGVTTETFTRGANANLFSWSEPFNDQQRRLITNWMQQTYEQFVERIQTTRKDKIKDIDEVAHGRIFLAKQARQLGMVDELGGLDKAIVYAAKKGGLTEGKYELRVVPATRTLIDLLRGNNPDALAPMLPRMRLDPMGLFQGLSRPHAQMLRQQLRVLKLLQDRPVILVSPYTFTVK